MPETRWPAALGRRGIVASPHPLATVAGLEVLLRGGTAVDAAVAVGATIAVVYPHMTGLGGDSFWLCWDARAARLTALQAAGAAAARATPDLYRRHGLDQIPARGPLAALTVPGAPDGLWTAHRYSRERLGSTMPWGDLLQAAIRHAVDGIPVSPCQSRVTARADRSARGRGARLRAVPGDLPRRRRGARAGPAARPAPPGAHARAARPRGRPRVLRGGPRGRDRTGVRGASGARCAREDLAGAPVALGRARHRAVSRRRRRLGPAALPGSGRARGPGDARRYRRPGARAGIRPTTSTSPSRPRSSPSATATAGSPIRSTSPCRSGVSSTRPTSGTAAGASRWTAPRPRRCPPASSAATRSPASRPTRRGTACPDPEHLPRVGLGRGRGRDGRRAPEPRRGLHARRRPRERARAGKAPLPHAHAVHVPSRREAVPASRGRWAGRASPRRSSRSRRGSSTSASTSSPPWKRRAGSTAGRGAAPTRALSIEGRFGDAVAADLARRGHAVQVLESWSDTAGHAQALQLEPGGLLVGGGDPRADGPALGC